MNVKEEVSFKEDTSNCPANEPDSLNSQELKNLLISVKEMSEQSHSSTLHSSTLDSFSQEHSTHNEACNDTEKFCPAHPGFAYTSYCKTCCFFVCEECQRSSKCSKHDGIQLPLLHQMQTEQLRQGRDNTKAHQLQLKSVLEGFERTEAKLRTRHEEMQNRLDSFHNYFLQVLQEKKEQVQNELERSHETRVAKVEGMKATVEGNLMEVSEAEALIETFLPLPFNLKFIPLKLDLIQRVEELVNYKPEFCDLNNLISELAFSANKQLVRSSVQNVYAKVEKFESSQCEDESMDGRTMESGGVLPEESFLPQGMMTSYGEQFYFRGQTNQGVVSHRDTGLHFNYQRDPSNNSVLLQPTRTDHQHNYAFQKNFQNPSLPQTGAAVTTIGQEDLHTVILPDGNLSSKVKRSKMGYLCKFGEFGNRPGDFSEPSGVAVSRRGEILIADANNHRIQAFDSKGVFKRVIGQDSAETDPDLKSQNERDLVYPNRLAVNKSTGDIYVTERSPTHQVRVYDEEGRFVRRFGSHVLQHPRGITVDQMGRIIVVECKVMRVVIFNSSGSVLNRFLVEKKVNFPNGVAVNEREEVFISDNRRHGVVVFDYHGAFLRTIGGMGVTNYPIGVGINSVGELVVADNHNNFNVTIFTQEGKYLRAMESRVKHAQCFDTALMGDSSIILSSKDYRIYVYHYNETADW